MVRVGVSEVVLCGSTREDDGLMRASDADSCSCISDTIQFALAVSRVLPGFSHGFEGFCRYSNSRVIRREIARDPKDLPPRQGGGPSMDGIREILGQIAQ